MANTRTVTVDVRMVSDVTLNWLAMTARLQV